MVIYKDKQDLQVSGQAYQEDKRENSDKQNKIWWRHNNRYFRNTKKNNKEILWTHTYTRARAHTHTHTHTHMYIIWQARRNGQVSRNIQLTKIESRMHNLNRLIIKSQIESVI